VGGIQDQITHDVDGLLLDDPEDLAGFARLLGRALDEEGLTARLGAAAHARVLDQYLGDRHLDQYVELFADLTAEGHPS
jgi:trehalose synthase